MIQERCQRGRTDSDGRSTKEMPPGQRQAIILGSGPCIHSLVIVSSRFNSVLADHGVSRQLGAVEGGFEGDSPIRSSSSAAVGSSAEIGQHASKAGGQNLELLGPRRSGDGQAEAMAILPSGSLPPSSIIRCARNRADST